MTEPADPDSNRPRLLRRCFTPALVAAYLALFWKLLIVLAPRGDVYEPDFTRAATVLVGEEPHRANVAMELLRGPVLALPDYQYNGFFGGSLVTGVCAVPTMALLGDHLLSLKLVPIAFAVLIAYLGTRLVQRFSGRRTAWFAAVLLGCATPTHNLLATIAWGSHVEAQALLLLGLATYFRARERGGWTWFALGVLAGFMLWYHYSTALGLALLAGFAVAARQWTGLARAVPGVLVGFVPWIVYNLRNDFEGLNVYGKSFEEHVQTDGVVARLLELVSSAFVRSLGFAGLPHALGGLVGVLTALVYGGLIALALWICWRARPRSPLLVFTLLFLASYLLLFAASDFDTLRAEPGGRRVITERYFVPLHVFVALGAALALGWVAERWSRTWAWVLAGCLCLASAVGTLAYVDPGSFAGPALVRASDDRGLGRWLAMRYGFEPERTRVAIERVRERGPDAVAHEITLGFANTLLYLTSPRALGGENSAQIQVRIEGYMRTLAEFQRHPDADLRALFDPARRAKQ